MTKTKLNKQLLGTWRSDRKKTLADYAPYHLPKNKKHKELISSMFGKLELRFTKKYIHSRFDGGTRIMQRYEMIDFSSTSIVLRYEDSMVGNLLEDSSSREFIFANFNKTRSHEYLYLTHSSARFTECFRRVKDDD